MQRLLYSIFISFFLIVSCAKSKPSGVVSEEKITEILTEVALVDGYLNTLPTDSSKRVIPVLYQRIFDEYKLDSATFVKNLDYYYGDPNLTEKIYTVIGKNLGVYERELQVEDSVRMVRYTDSMNIVNHNQRVYSRIENLRHFNANDTGYRNYYEFTKKVITNSNIEFVNKYFDLSPMPNLTMLNKDSLVNYARNFKSPFVYIDTIESKRQSIDNFKLNSSRFINKLKIYTPSGKAYNAPAEGQIHQVILDRTAAPEPIIDSLKPISSDSITQEVLPTPNDELRNNRLVKPVLKRLPQ
jgi:hypothetical protein